MYIIYFSSNQDTDIMYFSNVVRDAIACNVSIHVGRTLEIRRGDLHRKNSQIRRVEETGVAPGTPHSMLRRQGAY